jgi:PAS domain S-box-containing protein
MDQAVDDGNESAGHSTSLAEFRNSAECFAKAFHASPYVQAVTRFDSGRYLYVNDCFVEAAGYSRSEVIGKTARELHLVADDFDRSWLIQILRQRGRLRSRRLRFRTRSGNVRICLFDAEVIALDDEDVILSTVTDITQQLAAEHNHRLQCRRIALLERLAAGLAHELRSPLAGIKGVADAFLQRRRLTRVEREWMEAVRVEVLKIDSRLRDLLDLTQPRALSVAPCSLNDLVRRVVLLSSHHAKSIHDSQIRIEFVDTTTEPLNISIDVARLEDAVLNLVLNAIESIQQQGQVTVRLSRKKDSQRDHAVITVIDTGCGIAAEYRKRIFEPFFTTKPEGTGIGLSTVQRTAVAFNGRVTFKTRTGHGSTFELVLPLPDPHDSHEH